MITRLYIAILILLCFATLCFSSEDNITIGSSNGYIKITNTKVLKKNGQCIYSITVKIEKSPNLFSESNDYEICGDIIDRDGNAVTTSCVNFLHKGIRANDFKTQKIYLGNYTSDVILKFRN